MHGPPEPGRAVPHRAERQSLVKVPRAGGALLGNQLARSGVMVISISAVSQIFVICAALVVTTRRLRPGGSRLVVSANRQGNARAIAAGRPTAVSGQHRLPAGQGTGQRGIRQAAGADLDLGRPRDRSGLQPGYRGHGGTACAARRPHAGLGSRADEILKA
jgi:hypothetical protein